MRSSLEMLETKPHTSSNFNWNYLPHETIWFTICNLMSGILNNERVHFIKEHPTKVSCLVNEHYKDIVKELRISFLNLNN